MSLKIKPDPKNLVCVNCCTAVTFNLAFMILCVKLYSSQTYNQMALIRDETLEWSLGAITELKTFNSTYGQGNQCPVGYEQLGTQFVGTNSYCYYSDKFNSIGRCRRKSRIGKQIDGLDSRDLTVYKGNIICLKRDNNLNYHKLIETYRTTNQCLNNQKCGSLDDSNKQFCLQLNDTCPVNGFAIWNNFNRNLPRQFSESNRKNKTTLLDENWNITYVYDNTSNNPLADVYIQMSRPCGIRSNTYVNRTFKVDSIYSAGQCYFNQSGQIEHSLYYSAGFDETEGNIYRMNNLYEEIKQKIPQFSDEELSRNSYQIFYKPFTNYKAVCQQRYTSRQVEDFSARIVKTQERIPHFYRMSIAIFVFLIILSFVGFFVVASDYQAECSGIGLSFNIFSMVLITVISTACIALIAQNLIIYQQIDMEMIQFINQNECVDGPMNYAFKFIYNGIIYERNLTRGAFACIIAAFGLQIVTALFFTDFFYVWTCRAGSHSIIYNPPAVLAEKKSSETNCVLPDNIGSQVAQSVYGVSEARKMTKRLETFKQNNKNMLAVGRNSGPDQPQQEWPSQNTKMLATDTDLSQLQILSPLKTQV